MPGRKTRRRVLDLDDDMLHAVLRHSGNLGLGSASLSCRRLLGLVKSLSAEAKGTFDRWALAAASAGVGWNSLDCWLPYMGADRSFMVLCEQTGRLQRCSLAVICEELRRKCANASPGSTLIGRWGCAHPMPNDSKQYRIEGLYRIPCLLGCDGGELLRAAIVMRVRVSSAGGLVGYWSEQLLCEFHGLVLLKNPDAFQCLSEFALTPQTTFQGSQDAFIQGGGFFPLPNGGDAAMLCPLLLATLADPTLPSLAELHSLTEKIFSSGPRFRGASVWPARQIFQLILRAAEERQLEFLRTVRHSTNFVRIKQRPLRWLNRPDLAQLRRDALWRSGPPTATFDDLWAQLEMESKMETAQALLLRIVHEKLPLA